MLHLSAVSRVFRGMDHPAVDRLTLDIAPGEVVALAGASGSGKTTTLRLVAGFDTPDAGEISIAGEVVSSPRASVPPERRAIGVVFQDYALFPHLTVAENIAFGLTRMGTTEKRRRVEELLLLAGIPELIDRYPHECSGGQQQRVALVRALAPEPAVVLLDEPFSNLDHTCTHRMLAETRELLTASGATALVVTHDRYEAFTLADRIAVLEDGRLLQIGTAEELYGCPTSRACAEFAGSASFVPVAGGRSTVLGTAPDDVSVVPTEDGRLLAVVRPHQVVIERADAASGASANATVVDARMLGSVVAVRVALDGVPGASTNSDRHAPDAAQPGFEDRAEPILVHVPGPGTGLRAGERVRAVWHVQAARSGAVACAF